MKFITNDRPADSVEVGLTVDEDGDALITASVGGTVCKLAFISRIDGSLNRFSFGCADLRRLKDAGFTFDTNNKIRVA
ncbi:hypothetical protein [Caulobacter sp.]|uniref:hypothetical protein n=1 Tax=Caulobacter sp. TaxID=78 RepID=UPI0031E1C1E6